MRVAILLICTVLLSGCAMTITGVVSDKDTGRPVGLAAVGVYGLVVHTDSTGAYRIKVRVTKKSLEVAAAGYEPQTVPIDRPGGTRTPRVDVQLARDGASLPRNFRFDPYTGKPMAPRFDPYTGKPLSDAPAPQAGTGKPLGDAPAPHAGR